MAEHPKTLQEYRDRPRRRKNGTCAVCGGQGEARVSVTLQARERVEGRTAKDANATRYPAVDSRSATYCERHAIETYEEARSVLPSSRSVDQ